MPDYRKVRLGKQLNEARSAKAETITIKTTDLQYLLRMLKKQSGVITHRK